MLRHHEQVDLLLVKAKMLRRTERSLLALAVIQPHQVELLPPMRPAIASVEWQMDIYGVELKKDQPDNRGCDMSLRS